MKAIVKFDWDVFDEAQQNKLKEITIWPKEIKFTEKKVLDYDCREIILNLIKTNGLPDFKVLKILDTTNNWDQINSTIEKLNEAANKISFNQKCNVAVGGTNLKDIIRVTVEVDCCTDRLQSKLDEGWQILAICVQPNGRRPDYILGK